MLVGGGALQADALATRRGGGIEVVDADVDAVACVDETIARGGVTVNVVHKAISGVFALYIRRVLDVGQRDRINAEGHTV